VLLVERPAQANAEIDSHVASLRGA